MNLDDVTIEPFRERILKANSTFLKALGTMDHILMERCIAEMENILNSNDDPEVLEIYREGLKIDIGILQANLKKDIQITMF